MSLTAAIYSSTTLNASAGVGASLYSRDISVPLNSTLDSAADIGDLIQDKTQLDASSGLSRANPQQFYKFSLTGGPLKLSYATEVVGPKARIQVLNSSGSVLADSSTFADSKLQIAYNDVTMSTGLKLDDGDYFIKVTYDATSVRSVDVPYVLALYSGTQFSESYKTVAKPQTKESQVLINDKTMTFSTIDAGSFSTKAVHLANEDASSAISLGWMYENKSALGATSRLTEVCDEQYYSVLLQKGDNLKMALSNHTNTQDIRVQLYDLTGTVLMADSHGTDKQIEAYEKLISEEGFESTPGSYVFKLSYADEGKKLDQKYDFKIYSGDTYEAYYETTVQTETLADALNSGRLFSGYSANTAIATYLTDSAESDLVSVLNMFV